MKKKKWNLIFSIFLLIITIDGIAQLSRTDSFEYGIILDHKLNSYCYGKFENYGYLSKVDSLGNLIWCNFIGKSIDQTSIKKFIALNDTSYLVVGKTTSIDGFGSTDVFVQIIDSSGNITLSKLIGTSGYEEIKAAYIYQNNIYLAFYSTNFNINTENICLIKINIDGNIIWSKVYENNTSIDVVNDIFVNNDEIFIIGNSTLNSNKDCLLVKTDLNGNILWSRSYGGNNEDEFSSAIVKNNSIYLTGWTTSYGFGDKDLLALKIKNNGSWMWVKTIGDSYVEKGNSIQNNNDLLSISGYMQSTSGTLDDPLYITIDTNGIIQNKVQQYTTNDNYGLSSYSINNRNFLLSLSLNNGWNYKVDELNENFEFTCNPTSNPLDISNINITTNIVFFDEKIITSQLSSKDYVFDSIFYDTLLIPVTICLKNIDTIIDYTENRLATSNELIIYPNPTYCNQIHIKLPNKINANNSSLEIYNYSGQIIYYETISTNSNQLDLTLSFNPGFYFVIVDNTYYSPLIIAE